MPIFYTICVLLHMRGPGIKSLKKFTQGFIEIFPENQGLHCNIIVKKFNFRFEVFSLKVRSMGLVKSTEFVYKAIFAILC